MIPMICQRNINGYHWGNTGNQKHFKVSGQYKQQVKISQIVCQLGRYKNPVGSILPKFSVKMYKLL